MHTPALSDEEYLDLFRKIEAREITPAEAFEAVADHDFITAGIIVYYLLSHQETSIRSRTIAVHAIREWAHKHHSLIRHPLTSEMQAAREHGKRLRALL